MASTIGVLVKPKIPKLQVPHLSYVVAIMSVNIILCALILLIKDRIPPTVPLFYGRPRGSEQLAPQIFLLIPPGLSILVTILNTVISSVTDDKFIRRILIGIAFAATLLSTITIIKIILLVGSI